MSEAIEINPRTKLPDAKENPWVEMKNLPTGSMVIDSFRMREGRSGSKFINGDTLMARITPCLENGKTGFVDFLEENQVGRGSTEFIVLRGRKVSPAFVYCFARSEAVRGPAIKSMIGASGRQRVQESCFEKVNCWLPSSAIMRAFESIAEPVFQQIGLLRDASRSLRGARDILLPRLMSGEVAV